MSNLKLSTTNGSVTLKPEDGSGNVDVMIPRSGIRPSNEHRIGNIHSEVFQTTVTSTSASAKDLCIFQNVTGFSPNSKLELFYHVPTRNDSSSWGGIRIQPNISFDNGATWENLGNTGYENMISEASDLIHYYSNTMVIDPVKTEEYSVKIKLMFMAYESTVTVNGSHEINTNRTGMNTVAHADDLHHFTHIILKEYIPN